MGIKRLSTFLKKEEVHLPQPDVFNESAECHGVHPKGFFDCFNLDMDDVDAENIQEGQLNYWKRLMPLDGFCYNYENSSPCMNFEEDRIKKETKDAFLEDDDDVKEVSLNLSLNYQGVLDAWSNRTLWADDSSFATTPNNVHVVEDMAPVTEDDRRRREERVMRYKEKRQTRLFSKKIRYQVRKLNADKRPRLKGRFVRRVAEKMHK